MIYLDNAATTQIDPIVADTVTECMRNVYGNPSSLHRAGQQAAAKVEECKDLIAKEIFAKPNEIFFSSGGTHADNAAILGYARMHRKKGNHIITTQIEHPAVLNACRQLEKEGFEVTYLPVSREGLLSCESVKRAIKHETILISVMHTNNEIGTIQPIEAIGKIAEEHNIAFHCDAVQAFGKTELNVDTLHIDLMSAAAHKLHGPKGVGFLYVRSGIKLMPVLFGGEQEHRLFPGTLNAPCIAGFSKTVELVAGERKRIQTDKIRMLRDGFAEQVLHQIDGTSWNGAPNRCSAEHANLFFERVATDALLHALDARGICVSAGSACTAGSVEVSHVIRAISKDKGGASIRFSLSRFTTRDELRQSAEVLNETLKILRK